MSTTARQGRQSRENTRAKRELLRKARTALEENTRLAVEVKNLQTSVATLDTENQRLAQEIALGNKRILELSKARAELLAIQEAKERITSEFHQLQSEHLKTKNELNRTKDLLGSLRVALSDLLFKLQDWPLVPLCFKKPLIDKVQGALNAFS